MNPQTGKEKSLEFLTHALAEVGFSSAHARRACLATNLAGVPQAIEWALAHLDEETDAQGKDGRKDNGSNGFGSPGSVDNGLVVELPDGKLFKLSNPNGRVVEMPNGSVVEMIDGQVVEMSNGQQLEMVDGSLNEIRPAAMQLDDGEVVGHRILDYDLSRQVALGEHRGGNGASQNSNAPTPLQGQGQQAGGQQGQSQGQGQPGGRAHNKASGNGAQQHPPPTAPAPARTLGPLQQAPGGS
eukprot:CAMPEP_0180297170 /NCGR_PEP_ID=MMETSP0988-20121125/20238_1 /TAXON_ID=697907 /ORGANISM="non described non described, Strain CCMP2293" /LENGTH=240 /DNA_ID=CAMNT_0022275495 /DNA_START=215 /DNA_END=934 /DNA_ORIENTATION=+